MKELFVLIPGMERSSRFQQQEALVNGLMHASEQVILEKTGNGGVPTDMVRLTGAGSAGTERCLDFAEAYWNDLAPSLTQASRTKQMLRGLSLFYYWVFSRIWKGVLRRKYLTANIILSTVVLAFWYYGILALFVQALQADATEGVLPDAVSSFLQLDAVRALGSWKVWAVASSLMGILPVARMVDIMDFAKIYVSRESIAGENPPTRSQIVTRVRDQILAAFTADEYDRVTVVGHSFGAVVAVDVMADLPLEEGREFRLVTLGSSLELLSKRASWLDEEKENCLARPELLVWVDVDSRVDWLATGSELPDVPKAENESIPPSGTLVDRFVARTHTQYFENQAVANILLRTARGA